MQPTKLYGETNFNIQLKSPSKFLKSSQKKEPKQTKESCEVTGDTITFINTERDN